MILKEKDELVTNSSTLAYLFIKTILSKLQVL